MEKSETVEYKNSLLNPTLKIIIFNNLMYFLMPRIYSYIYIFIIIFITFGVFLHNGITINIASNFLLLFSFNTYLEQSPMVVGCS